MRIILVAALLLASAAVSAQTVDTNANAISGSQSGSESAANNANTVAPNQQSALQASLTNNFEAAKPLRTTRVETANAVPLAAAVSFSADNCMSVASGGLSLMGGGFGIAKPIPDFNCQAIRRSQNFGIAMANAANIGQESTALKLLQMQIYEACMAGNGPERSFTAEACEKLALIGEGSMVHTAAVHRETNLNAIRSNAITPTPRDQFIQKVIVTGSNGVSTQVTPK